MPVITLQVGQCGNQIGQSLWQALDAQCGSSLGPESTSFFKIDPSGRRQARCLLIDTEPKVVQSVMQKDCPGIFSRSRCYLGQSGRGNNWAFGYSQSLGTSKGLAAAAPSGANGGGVRLPSPEQQRQRRQDSPPVWNSSVLVEEPGQEEFHILEQVVEGVRRECEECDGAADFLMLHSLGGGSGSGLGSRLLEHLRDQYPLHNIATVSVAPRPAGDSPMQSLNSVLSLSFLQAYADVVLMYNNQEMIDAAGKGLALAADRGGASLEDVNGHIARSVVGALWPLTPGEGLGGSSRIRDMVGTVAANVCCKMVETRTAYVPPSVSSVTDSVLRDACRALGQQYSRFDQLDGGRPITSSGALLLARGFPPASSSDTRPMRHPSGRHPPSSSHSAAAAALEAYVKTCGGRSAFIGGGSGGLAPGAGEGRGQGEELLRESLWFRSSPGELQGCSSGRDDSGATRGSGSRSAQPTASGRKPSNAGMPSLTSVANRSSMVGLLGATVDRATAIWQAGAYLHWYEKCGCSKEAVRCAIEQVADVADAYRVVHGIQDWLE